MMANRKIKGDMARFGIPAYEDEAAMDAAVVSYWGPDDDDDESDDASVFR